MISNSDIYFTCRSKSLTALKADSVFRDDAKISLSIENLLSASQNDLYSLNSDLVLNQNETLDYELHLDEALFEHEKGTKSEGQLSNPPVPIQNQIRPLPIENLSRKHRKQSDPYFIREQQTGTSLRTENETRSLPRDPKSFLDFQANQSHQVSRRTSATSDIQSDISSDFITDHEEGHSRSFKSVRFDVGEDSGMESGPVTGASTPYYPPQSGRRASEPKCKAMNNRIERRGSAPECKSLGSNSHESLELTQIDSTESQVMSSKSDANFDSLEEREKMENANEQLKQESVKSRVARPATDGWTGGSSGLELTDLGDSKAQVSGQLTAGLRMPQHLVVNEHNDSELISHEKQPSASVVHLIENWAEFGSEVALYRHEPPRAVELIPRKKVATIKQKFQGSARETSTPGYQPTPEMNRPRRQLSQLVADTTKQLFQEKLQEKSVPLVITRTIRQATLESQLQETRSDSEASSSTTLLQTSSSQLLTASGPQLDLIDHKHKRVESTEAETVAETEEGAESEHSAQMTQDTKATPAIVPASRLSGDLEPILEENEDCLDSRSESEPTPTLSPVFTPTVSPEFERKFHDIPVFTSPFMHTPWQPWHLQQSSQTPTPSYPSLLGFSNPAFDDDSDDDLEDIDLGNFGDEDRAGSEALHGQPLLPQSLPPPPTGPTSNFANISPIGKGLFSQRLLSRPQTSSTTTTLAASSNIRRHMLAIKDIKQAQLGTGEAFYRLADYHRTKMHGLSSIPEESPSSSRVDIHTLS